MGRAQIDGGREVLPVARSPVVPPQPILVRQFAPPKGEPMGFFDDVVSGIGSLAGAAAGVVRAIPGAQFTPLGAAATAVGDFASGGFAGLAGNVLGRATSLAPLVGSALGAPQLGTLAGSILGRLSPAGSFGGGFMGGQPNPGAL